MAMPYPAYGAPRPPPNHNDSYPPNGPFNPASVSSFNSTTKNNHDDPRVSMGMSRTPSPTPSEAKILNEPLFSWAQLTNWRFWIRKEWTTYYIIGTVILVITALTSIYHHDIVKWLTPVTKWLHDLKYGFLVPIGILFVISFPPLFGHEIVAILCGLVWGLWFGFAIVCAGTFLGEVGNFYAFKWCCRARGEKMERTQISYACLARCVRTGGFRIALIARFSAIPGHFTTAVFSTCGMNIFVFSLAAFLSLPKQFITVYLGVILEQADAGKTDKKSTIISDSVLAATFLVTILAMWYIFHQMSLMKPFVIYERRKARQGKVDLLRSSSGTGTRVELYSHAGMNDSDASVGGGGAFDPRASLSDIPLTAKGAGDVGEGIHPRYDYEQQQRQRQQAEWAAQRRQYDEQQRGRPGAGPGGGGEAYSPYSQQPQQQQHHQQWDAQGRAIGYTPGPVGQVLYAPQPQQAPRGAGRAEIRPGAYVTEGQAEVYAHSRGPAVNAGRQDSEEVGWDMQMRELRPQPQQTQSPRQQTMSPPTRYMSPPQQARSPPVQQQQQQRQAQNMQPQQEAGTPTQAQYASYQPPPSAASTTLAYLRSPFDDVHPEPGPASPPQGHFLEPTGASYHTAYGSEDALLQHEPESAQAQGQRAFSPPPPSYRTDARR
ncbi:hypothetical protein B0H13DRAFT_2009146 [Mycena leptocephala]|nr:hypothetical protein B0H13DRAFT_2009146 [Mycena leptocephala]